MVIQKPEGFTLVELIVVLAMLAILAIGLIFIFNPFKQINKTYDAQRVQDLTSIAQSLDSYYNDHNFYPQSVPFGQKWGDVNSTYMQQVPEDPQQFANEGYCYFSDPNSFAPQWNALFAKLTNSQNSPQCHLSSNCLPQGYTNDWACKASGKVDCNVLSKDSLPCTMPITTVTTSPTSQQVSPTISPTPTPSCLYPIGSYCLGDTKFLRNYAVVTFTDPGFPAYSTQADSQGGTDSGWSIDLSFRPDFGGTTVVDGFGYYVNGVPATTNADTDLWAAYAGDGLPGTTWSTTAQIQESLIGKYTGYISMPFEWSKYVNECGQKIYWRVVNFRTGIPGVNYDSNKFSQTFTNTIDCTTKVGVLDNGVDLWKVPQDDLNKDGISDWTDYIIGSLLTKFRYGGWQPPE